jgi:streptogramin lyase
MKKIITIILPAIFAIQGIAQDKPLGTWTDHLPYSSGEKVAIGNNKVYCSTGSAIFYINKDDNSISRKSKVNGLSDVGISSLAFNDVNQTLVIAYANGNIDLMRNDAIFNIPFLKNNLTIPNTSINDVYVENEFVYISSGFGILKLNTSKREISDSYIIGQNGVYEEIFDVTILRDTIYAATKNGIKYAPTSVNLTDYRNWKVIPLISRFEYKAIEKIGDKLIAVTKKVSTLSDSIFIRTGNKWSKYNGYQVNEFNQVITIADKSYYVSNRQIGIMDVNLNMVDTISNYTGVGKFNPSYIALDKSNGNFWYADLDIGLVENQNNNFITYSANGPRIKNVFKLEASGGKVYAVQGGLNSAYNNLYKYPEISVYNSGIWNYLAPDNDPKLNGTYDLLNVTIDRKNKNHVFIGSWGAGLIEMLDDKVINVYDSSNSRVPSRTAYSWFGVAGTSYDNQGNLWVSSTYTDTLISVKQSNGKWMNYGFPEEISSAKSVGDILITNGGLKWVLLPRVGSNVEIFVFDDNGTIEDRTDDRKILLNSNTDNGNLPGARGLVGAVDQDGEIWIGTDDGLAVFYNPDGVFDGAKNAQRILIKQGADVEILLEAIKISDIKIDGANRKWIATEGQGVYLLSEDGTEEVLHFTINNSPLISNNVFGIAIDDVNGEVFFATEDGIVSYKGDATNGFDDFDEVEVYPNPVRPEYEGPIAIRGLVNGSIVKITDINGKLVREMKSLGGQAIWDGKTINGDRAATGVYLVFSSSGDGQGNLKTNVGKILFIN